MWPDLVDADVATDTNGPEVRIAGALDPVEAQAGRLGVFLEVENHDFDGLLLRRGEAGQGGSEGGGDTKLHTQTQP